MFFLASPPSVHTAAGMPDDHPRHIRTVVPIMREVKVPRLRSRRERAVERAVLVLLVANLVVVAALVWLAMSSLKPL